MSALPPIADITRTSLHFRFVPKDDIRRLLEDLVGEREQIVRNGNPERLCRLEVDDQLELGCVEDRQVRGLRPLENPRSIEPDLSVTSSSSSVRGDKECSNTLLYSRLASIQRIEELGVAISVPL